MEGKVSRSDELPGSGGVTPTIDHAAVWIRVIGLLPLAEDAVQAQKHAARRTPDCFAVLNEPEWPNGKAVGHQMRRR